MATIRNTSGRDLNLPWLNDRLVLAGAETEVPDDTSYNYTTQSEMWAPVDEAAQNLHTTGRDAETPPEVDTNSRPPGNASREEWAAYGLTQGSSETEIEPLTRDDLRARFTPKEG